MKALSVLEEGFQLKIGEGNTSLWYDPWVLKERLCDIVWAVNIHDVELKINDVFKEGEWKLEQLYTPLPEEVR